MNELLTSYQRQQFQISDLTQCKNQLLHWANQFDCCCFLDSNESSNDPYQEYECLLAVGVEHAIVRGQDEKGADKHPFDNLRNLHQTYQDWIFGCFSYDLKNDVERLESQNPDGLGMPDYHFFVPQYIFSIEGDQLLIQSKKEPPSQLFRQINQYTSKPVAFERSLDLQARMPRSNYLKTVEKIQADIVEGTIYEMNFCQEFYAEDCQLDPLPLFHSLNQLSQAPFAAYYKLGDQYLLCASPERFIKKKDSRIISQPIKGTIKRSTDKAEDEALKQQLYQSEKDRAENVMIVDLVRNDLARTCQPGSVEVEELFGIYSFEQVHQMISTVSGQLRADKDFVDVLQNAFPMGSMTGAPKVMSMQLIEAYEQSRRGWYSGSIGYITPTGDFDFNVVIRSLIYNAARHYLSLHVGGAIVYDSVPHLEYEECLLKAAAMRQIGLRLDFCT